MIFIYNKRFFNDAATTNIYTLPLPDALPIYLRVPSFSRSFVLAFPGGKRPPPLCEGAEYSRAAEDRARRRDRAPESAP